MHGAACEAGRKTCPPACSGHCPSAPGSSGCGAWAWTCWCRCGVMPPARVRPRVAGGNGPGAPCRDKLHWVQTMLDGRVAAFRRRGVALPPPMVVADSWFSDSKLMRLVAATHRGTLLVEGKSTYVFELADGRQEEHSVILTPFEVAVDGVQIPDRRYRYTWRSEVPTSHCRCTRTTMPPSA